jgi:hypothetical protein
MSKPQEEVSDAFKNFMDAQEVVREWYQHRSDAPPEVLKNLLRDKHREEKQK